jgi:hypothetical protein
MGSFLPPSDRANLSGPYYQNAWNYPTTVNGYPSIYQHAVAATGGDPARTIDAGLNYILDGHNARAGLVVQNMRPTAGSSSTGVQLGIQIQE